MCHVIAAYINCRPVLRSTGKQTCFYPDKDPSYCDISCEGLGEEWKGTSMQRYECLNDTFGNSLPFCAVLNKYGRCSHFFKNVIKF